MAGGLEELDFLLETEHALEAQLERVRNRMEVILTMGEKAVVPMLKLVVDNTREGQPNGQA